MKKIFILFLSFSFFLLLSQLSGFAQCRPKIIAKNCKSNMQQFVYDSYVTNELKFDDTPKKIEVEFTAFAGEKYRLVFCTSGFKEEVKLNIYDKSNKVKKRNKVYDTESGIDNLFWTFDPIKTGTYYIEYEVPVALDAVKKNGCMVMLIGYEE